MGKDVEETPAQRDARLARVAKNRGRDIADWSEKTASEIAQKDREALKNRTVGPGGHQYGQLNEYETPVFENRMSAAMSSELEARRRRQGKPTGYDAAMRGTVSSSTSSAMQKSSAAMEKMRRLAQAAKKKP